jgi:hypothetical protein
MPIPEPEPTPRLDPASYDDAWDDPELLEEEQAVGRVQLPPKREPPPADASPVRVRKRVEMGLQISANIRTGRSVPDTEETGPAEEVVKLDCPSPDQPFQPSHMIVPRRDQEPEPPPEPVLGKLKEEGPDWGKRPKQSLRWLLGASAGVVIILVLAIATQELWIRATPDPSSSAPESVLADPDPLPEVEGFEIDGTSEQQSRALLATIAKAGAAGEILPFIRNRDPLVTQVTRDWQPWGTPPDWDGPDNAAWRTGSESGRGFGVLSGSKPDLTPFQAYFVREQGILKLDWEATTGASATPFGMLVQGRGAGGITRCLVRLDSFFTDTFPEQLYRSFKLLSPDLDQVVWAYTRLGSKEDTAIMAFFPSGILLESENGQLPMTVILAPPAPGAQKNQWLITEMLHNDWVSP